MYERSAIVLERYFSNLLGLNKVNNLKRNFNNYCELFEKFKVSQAANSEEFSALKEFQSAENEIEEIQSHEEKLYKKNAKLEYNRDLVFQDISQKPEEIEKCGIKLEADIAKVQEKLVSLREEFVEAVRDYDAKKSVLSKCKKARKSAEADYNAIFDEASNNVEKIPEEYIQAAKDFLENDIQSDIVSTMTENGKEEKIPFNNQVMTCAAKIGYEMASREAVLYLQAYGLCQKLINELLDGAVSVELHEKAIRNISAELNFLAAEKEYIVGFLDYERITVIYGKRMHRTLMVEACEKLEKDIEQVENLYTLLSKEISEKPTKKAYKELYNKSYLMEIEDKDAKFKKEKNKVNLSSATIMNSNYWRIEGIKSIYTVFYKTIVEVFGRDLDEFEIPEDQEEAFDEDGNPIEVQTVETIEVAEEVAEKVEKVVKEAKKKEKVETEIVKSEAKEELIVKEEPKAKETTTKAASKAKEEQKAKETEKTEAKTNTKKKKVYTSKEKLGARAKKQEDKKPQEKVAAFEEENIEESFEEAPEEVVQEVFDPIVGEVFEPGAIEVATYEIQDDTVEDRKTLKLAKIVKKRGRKKVRHYTRQIVSVDEEEFDNEPIQEAVSEEDEFDIFGEKYKDIDLKIAELDDIEDYEVEDAELSDVPEESIFEVMNEDDDKLDLEEFEMDEDDEDIKPAKKKKSKNGLFSNLKKLNSKSKKELAKE